MQWYYAINGQQFGPVESDQLSQLIKDGRIQPDDLVWNQDMGDHWVAASSIKSLCTEVQTAATQDQIKSSSPSEFRPGMKDNTDLMRLARETLQGHWGIAIGTMLIYIIIVSGVSALPRIGSVISFIVDGPLRVGVGLIFLAMVRRQQEPDINLLFKGFNSFLTALLANVLMTVFILLWTLLLVIPGIVAGLSYALTIFIIADNPSIQPLEAIQRSKQMMQGHKWQLFCLHFRFIGWVLLSVLTCGIGLIWVMPYVQASTAQFYEEVRRHAQVAP